MKKIVSILLAALLFAEAAAQELMPPVRKVEGFTLYFTYDENGDTLFWDVIEPAWCFPRGRKMKKNDWRRKYKLVYNFNKVYPYALAARKMMRQVDSTIAADATLRSERNEYVKDVQKELFRIFEKDVRNMTFSQGGVLLRLVDRECGMSGYEIIKTYRNGFVASFWQGVAWLFGGTLKRKYDPKGNDRDLETLVGFWENGDWRSFYFSIFCEYPKETVIPIEKLNSTVKSRKKNRDASGR